MSVPKYARGQGENRKGHPRVQVAFSSGQNPDG